MLALGGVMRTGRPGEAIVSVQLVRSLVPGVVKSPLLSQADLLLLPGTRGEGGSVTMEAAPDGISPMARAISTRRDAILAGVTMTRGPSKLRWAGLCRRGAQRELGPLAPAFRAYTPTTAESRFRPCGSKSPGRSAPGRLPGRTIELALLCFCIALPAPRAASLPRPLGIRPGLL